MMDRRPTKRRARTLAISAVVLLIFAVAAMSAVGEAVSDSPLSMRRVIDARYPGVPWVETAAFAGWLNRSADERPIVLDARQPAEYVVSHIVGARRVDPDNPDIEALGICSCATVVVYCSVGYRSAAVATRLRAAGHDSVYNLAGGIFQWANEGRPVYRGQQPATQVHPYDTTWGRMLEARFRATL